MQAFDLIDATQNLDGLVAVSGAVKTCAVNLSKMSNDLRLMSSGPRCGFSEINLPPRQNGSSIMPGKVNPVIPEVVSQVAFNIIGNDVTVTMAAEAGQLELNAFEPIIFYNLIQSVETLTYAVHTFVDNCVTGITANRERCRDMVEHSVGIITALCPHVGYEKAAEVAKRAIETGAPVRRLILEEGLLDEAALDKILDPYSMTEPGISGKELLEGERPGPRPCGGPISCHTFHKGERFCGKVSVYLPHLRRPWSGERAYACPNGHAYDKAREGYVHLLPANKSTPRPPATTGAWRRPAAGFSPGDTTATCWPPCAPWGRSTPRRGRRCWTRAAARGTTPPDCGRP